MPGPRPIGECPGCHGWGGLRAGQFCPPCHDWARENADVPRQCQRCSHRAPLNRNQLCRLCLITIRTNDKIWISSPRQHQPTQLFLLLHGVGLPNARGLNRRPSATTASPVVLLPPRNPAWVCEALNLPTANDPDICPPLPEGQLVLLRLPRAIAYPLALRIADRAPAGYAHAAEVARGYAAELGRTQTWRSQVWRVLGLALAAAEAEGYPRVPQEWLLTAHLAGSVTEVLRRAGLLEPWTGSGPLPQRLRPVLASGVYPNRPRSCTGCHSWGMQTVCEGCQWWLETRGLGDCDRCRHTKLHVGPAGQGGDGGEMLCRNCTLTLHHYGPDALTHRTNQLSLGGPFALRLHTPAGMLGYQPPKWKAVELAKARRPAPPPVSPHLLDPHQPELFILRRDWSCITRATVLPSLTPAAQRLIDDISLHAKEFGWLDETVRPVRRTLRILLSWLGAEAPIREEDVLALRSRRISTTGTRVVAVLAEHGLLIPADSRATSVHQRWIDAQISTLPDGLAAELRIWVTVMRGTSRRRRHSRSWTVIRNYLFSALPTLTSWSTNHASLREITNDNVRAALRGLTGTTAHTLRTALRSIFKALNQERIVFRDPTRGITLAPVTTLPTQLRDDQLRGLIDRADGTLGRLVVALVAVHALNPKELRGITLADVDNSKGKLTVRRQRGRDHTVYLDELCLQLLLTWLTERHQRWPDSTNPHLLITTHGAYTLSQPPIAQATIASIFRTVGVQARHIRFDRLLHEAATTADPIHLIHVFGISPGTAMRYLHAAHPERAAAPPR